MAMAKFLTLKWNISRTIRRIEVGDGSIFCIFRDLSFELKFFRPEFPFNCKKWLRFLSLHVSLNLLVITDNYDKYDYMRTRLYCLIVSELSRKYRLIVEDLPRMEFFESYFALTVCNACNIWLMVSSKMMTPLGDC